MSNVIKFPENKKVHDHKHEDFDDDDLDSLLDHLFEKEYDEELDCFMEQCGRKAKKIRLLALDVDGVLTDGTIYIGDSGEMFKGFNAKDGMGISYAIRNGIKVCLITGRESEIVRRRAGELGITCVMEGVKDKAAALRQIAQEEKIKLTQIAYIGDDLNDLAAMKTCGLSFAPADAVDTVLVYCDFELDNDGGKGAVREAIDLLLEAQGKLDEIVASYIYSGQGDKQ